MDNLIEWLKHWEWGRILVGASGAAIVAVTDWSSPQRFLKHMFVGTVSAVVASPFFTAILYRIFELESPSEITDRAGTFLTGGFAIYLYQFAIATLRERRSLKNGDNNEAS